MIRGRTMGLVAIPIVTLVVTLLMLAGIVHAQPVGQSGGQGQGELQRLQEDQAREIKQEEKGHALELERLERDRNEDIQRAKKDQERTEEEYKDTRKDLDEARQKCGTRRDDCSITVDGRNKNITTMGSVSWR